MCDACVGAGAPLAPPPSDATKPKIPSGPDLRVPGPPSSSPSSSLGATPQLANAPAQAANKAGSKVLFRMHPFLLDSNIPPPPPS